jgi:hypothetical protein
MHIRASSLLPQIASALSVDAQWLVDAEARWLADMATVAQVAGRNDDAVFFINLTYAALDRDADRTNQSSPVPAEPAKPIRRDRTRQAALQETEASRRIRASTSQVRYETLPLGPTSQSSSSLSE